MEEFRCSDTCAERALYREHTVDFSLRRSIADKKVVALQHDPQALINALDDTHGQLIDNPSSPVVSLANLLYSSMAELKRKRTEELDSRITLLASCATFCSLEGACVLRSENETYRFKNSQ